MPGNAKRKLKNPRSQVEPLTPEQSEEITRIITQRTYGRKPLAFIQPDYSCWQKIKIGMSRSHVVSLLGEPIKHRGVTLFPPDFLYGFLDFRNVDFLTYQFAVGYDNHDRVFRKMDPFIHPLSEDGRPSKPHLIIPQDRSAFRHFPRLVDLRWQPCSGQYPIEYTVEVGISMRFDENYRDWKYHIGLFSPSSIIEMPGSQPGRVRVRGINTIGEGQWSDYRYFTFGSNLLNH
jgi:hypothetical protein